MNLRIKGEMNDRMSQEKSEGLNLGFRIGLVTAAMIFATILFLIG